MKSVKDPERARKYRKRFRVILEIAFMTLGVLCAIMPPPFPLLVPIGIGAIRIISNAVRSEKQTATPPPVEHGNSAQRKTTAKNSTSKKKKEKK